MSTVKPATIDDYIAGFQGDVRARLETIRRLVHETVPDATETIAYQMPTFTLAGTYLVYFAAFKKHISLFPAPIGVADFADVFAPYAAGRGTLQFPHTQPLPLDLMRRFVEYRAQQIRAR
jgi:uncharacterized protein YdhG (YjbR/CyaY superfamily)